MPNYIIYKKHIKENYPKIDMHSIVYDKSKEYVEQCIKNLNLQQECGFYTYEEVPVLSEMIPTPTWGYHLAHIWYDEDSEYLRPFIKGTTPISEKDYGQIYEDVIWPDYSNVPKDPFVTTLADLAQDYYIDSLLYYRSFKFKTVIDPKVDYLTFRKDAFKIAEKLFEEKMNTDSEYKNNLLEFMLKCNPDLMIKE